MIEKSVCQITHYNENEQKVTFPRQYVILFFCITSNFIYLFIFFKIKLMFLKVSKEKKKEHLQYESR